MSRDVGERRTRTAQRTRARVRPGDTRSRIADATAVAHRGDTATDAQRDDSVLAQLTAHVVLAGQMPIADLAELLGIGADDVRAAIARIAAGLGAAGLVVIDDGVRIHVSGRRPQAVSGDAPLAWAQELDAASKNAESASAAPRRPRRSGSSTGRRLVAPVLIDRDLEIASLLEAASAPPSLVLLEGEAGVGKTRLVTDFLARPELTGVRRLVGRCHPLREPFPYGPVLEALRGVGDLRRIRGLTPLAGVLRYVLPEVADDLPPIPEAQVGARPDRHLVVRAIHELIAHLGPTVLVLEDMHWADDNTIDLVRFLAARFPPELTLIATYRDEAVRVAQTLRGLTSRGGPSLEAAVIHLAPLSIAGVRKLVGAILDTDDVSDAVAAHVHARTAGMPLAVEEMVYLVQEHPDLVRRSDVGTRRALEGLDTPPAIRDSVIERSARLSPDARRIVDAAAILGLPSTLDVLSAVARLPNGRSIQALRDAADAALLLELEPNRYGLRHALAVKAVYDAIPQAERVVLHQRAARALEDSSPKPVALLARHHQAAGNVREWLVYAEAAADIAAERGNDADAVRLLGEALRSRPAVAIRTRLGIKLGRAALTAHAYREEATATLREMVADRALPRAGKGKLHALLGLLMIEAGDASSGYELETQAARELRREPEAAALVMGNLAMPFVVEGRESEHRRWLELAVEAAAQQDDASVRLTIQGFRALIPLYLGDPDGWRMVQSLPAESATVAENRQLLWLASHLVGACYYLGHYERARDFLIEGNDRAGALGWDRFLALRQTAALMLEWATGEWDGLDTRIARHVEDMAVDYPVGAILGKLTGALLMLARGKLDDADRDLRACMAATQTSGLIPALSMAAGGLARIHLLRGLDDEACDEAMAAVEVAAQKEIWVWAADAAPVAVEALVRRRRVAEARRLTGRFARGLRGRDAPLADAALGRCRGLVAWGEGKHRVASGILTQAARGFAARPRPYDAALATIDAGTCLLDAGDAAAADSILAGLVELDRLGADLDARRVRKQLRDRSIPVPSARRGAPHTYGSALSPREIEVAELAARGDSTPDIARTLFLSPKTVEAHLATIMRKLGIKNRAQLILLWAAQRPAELRGRTAKPRGGGRP